MKSPPAASTALLEVRAIVDSEATALLKDPAFRREWQELYDDCPWATVFQGVDFSDAWWDVYARRFDPRVLLSRDECGRLRGLLNLVRDRMSGELLHIGTHHAEYHAWLSSADDADPFMTSVVHLLRAKSQSRVLRFQYLAPGAPLGWTRAFSSWRAPGCIVRAHQRGIRELGSPTSEGQSLRKKSNKSKLQRMARVAPVEFKVLSSIAELDLWMPQIKDQCDRRHSVHTGTGPFEGDPLKETFFRRLMAQPGLLHASVLVRGEQLLASHLGLVDGTSLSLGLFTHEIAEHANSPGKLLLHRLAQEMAATGLRALDLTPGDDYKLRFANRIDIVHTLEIRFGQLDLALRRMITRSDDREQPTSTDADLSRRALFVCYFYPPLLTSGTARSVEFTRRLPALGWEVTILTVQESRDPWEKGRGGEVPPGVRVHRSTELPLAHALDILQAILSRLARLAGRTLKGHPLRAVFAFPDPQVAWQSTVPGIRHGRDCDVVYASCSPFSSAISGRLISLVLRKPLVLDFRDPWTVNPYMQIAGLRGRLTKIAERWCLSGASAVLLNTVGTERLYRDAYPEFTALFRVVPNGFDRLTPVEREIGRPFRIFHVGSFYGARRPDLLLEALSQLIAEGQVNRSDVEFVQLGEAWPSFSPWSNDVVVRELPPVPREEALALMSGASLLYLKQGWEEGISEYVSVAAKTYEYLATGLPILAECPPGDNLDIVKEYSERSYIVSTHSLEEMRQALLNALAERALPTSRVPQAFIDRFSRDNLATRLAEILSTVVQETR
jgi:CelD/BcsL family acetyltransferase involved in cellulose biosynthesis/glycosyltransferase involved in cell wall biosynthesis